MRKYLTLLFFCLTCVASNAFDFTYQGVDFKCKITGKSVCITSFSVKAKNVIIPAVVTNKGVEYQVKSVSTFLNGVNYLAETLVLEEGIEDIDKYSFNEFRKLLRVTLPSTLRHIGKNAFRENSGMSFQLASNINEQALRKGQEVYPTGNGTPYSNLLANNKTNNPVVIEKPKETPPQIQEANKPKNSPTPVIPKKSPDLAVDVDMDIPLASVKNEDTYCVIIANEKYEDVPAVDYASRDGEVFREYCVKTLGVPEKQIKTFINASYTDIKRAMNWIETISDITEGKSKFIFYYAGHGLPSEKDKTAYLIPIDGFPKDLTTCYKLSELYSRLSKIKTQSVTVFLDACFSGIERGNNQALVAARGVAIKPKQEVLEGNIVVFSATSDDETALSYKEKRHGLFTYFLLNQLKETMGKAKYGELFKSITLKVKMSSVLENEKLQTPSVNVSASMKEIWQNLHF